MDATPYLILLAIVLVKEGGVPIPVPGDLLVLGAGVSAAGEGAGALAVLAGILVAGYLGGTIQFVLVRRALRRPMLALLHRLGVSSARLDALAARLQAGGSRAVAIARATPGLRIGAIAASGLAALPFVVFARGLVAGNTVFVGGHFALGYLIGVPALAVVAGATGPALLVIGIGVLAVVGRIAWRRLRTRGAADGAAWVEAACPVCLGLELVGDPAT
jgi:membrane protein DedA with SNARE-associated domain